MPIPPGEQLYRFGSDRDLYDHYRDLGLSPVEAKSHVERRRANRVPAEAPDNPDLGEIAAGRLGAAQGLGGAAGALAGGFAGSALGPLGAAGGALIGGFGGGAAMKPLTELLSSAPASDVKEQWNATTGAHPGWELGGQIAGGLVGGGIGNRIIKTLDDIAMRTAQRKILEAQARALTPVPPLDPVAMAAAKYGVPASRFGQAAVDAPRAPVNYPEAPLAPSPKPVPDPLAVPTAVRSGTLARSPITQKYVAKSYPELERLVNQVPTDQIKVGYYTRGGALQQTIAPLPTAAAPPRGLLMGFDKTDPAQVAEWLKDQMRLAESMGQPVTSERLSALLRQFDPKVIGKVQALLQP